MFIKLDNIGRITIPMEIRKKLHINNKDNIRITINNKIICIEKIKKNNNCCICLKTECTNKIGNKNICNDCIKHLKENINK